MNDTPREPRSAEDQHVEEDRGEVEALRVCRGRADGERDRQGCTDKHAPPRCVSGRRVHGEQDDEADGLEVAEALR